MQKADKEYLFKLRHSAEHILTQAMHRLYGKDRIVMAMGPATEEGFYFDFDSGDLKIGEENFKKIEAEMRKIVQEDLPIVRREVSIGEAREMFAGNPFKQEWLDEIEAKGEGATVYETGDPDSVGASASGSGSNSDPDANPDRVSAGSGAGFIDLCKGPHVDSTGEVGAFKLLSVAGAYWRGDEKNKMLTRIYGTAFATKEELDAFIFMREEAIKRDHKKLGRELDLFTFSDLVGAGLPLWTPRGTVIRNLLNDYVWQLRKARGYEQVTIPHITKSDLYEKSGHWAKYKDDLFKINTREGHLFAMKPMNCPHHTQIYDHLPRSYRDLPQRYAETTMVYRDEQTGELSGLSRVRCITQDDAHVFCRESQLEAELLAIWDIIETFYKATGFGDLEVRLSLHDPEKMENYLGDEKDWLAWEDGLRSLIKKRGADFYEEVGEAAFYGPKIDFMTKDSLGREWQVATIQADRNMPERFELNCVNENNETERIVMAHAAIMGSIERFMSILIEHHAGAFPVWLAPVQAVILPISDKHHQYAQELAAQMVGQGLRVVVNDSNDSLSKKIRNAQNDKVPYMLVVGDKEMESKSVAVRRRSGREQEVMKVEDFVGQMVRENTQKTV